MENLEQEARRKRKAYNRLLPVGAFALVFALAWGHGSAYDMTFDGWAYASMAVIVVGAWLSSVSGRVPMAVVDIVLQAALSAFLLAKIVWAAWFVASPVPREVVGPALFVVPFFAWVFWANPVRRRAMGFSWSFLALLVAVAGSKLVETTVAGVASDVTYVLVLSVTAGALLLLILQAYGDKERRFERAIVRTASEARQDPLTQVLNRRGVERYLEACREAFDRQGVPFSVVLTDLDHFKRVNDVHGHGVGDEVLRAIGRTLRDGVRDPDHVARWGGEEFLVLVPGVRLPQAATLAERLRASIARVRLTNGVRVTASCGVAEVQPGDGIESLIARADGALYEAKANGRDQVVRRGIEAWARTRTGAPGGATPAAPARAEVS
jgi:diguanylate cyclase (GGDEF)-like protein